MIGKISAILCVLIIFACRCGNNVQTKLLREQKLFKDSANNINDRIGAYMHKGHNDSAAAEKLHLGSVHARLIAIQKSMDSLANAK